MKISLKKSFFELNAFKALPVKELLDLFLFIFYRPGFTPIMKLKRRGGVCHVRYTRIRIFSDIYVKVSKNPWYLEILLIFYSKTFATKIILTTVNFFCGILEYINHFISNTSD